MEPATIISLVTGGLYVTSEVLGILSRGRTDRCASVMQGIASIAIFIGNKLLPVNEPKRQEEAMEMGPVTTATRRARSASATKATPDWVTPPSTV